METLFSTIILGAIGFREVLILAVIVLLLFGGKKIPELMKGLGSGIKEFKNSVKDDEKKPTEEPKTNA